jgi:hypothetical protein
MEQGTIATGDRVFRTGPAATTGGPPAAGSDGMDDNGGGDGDLQFVGSPTGIADVDERDELENHASDAEAHSVVHVLIISFIFAISYIHTESTAKYFSFT